MADALATYCADTEPPDDETASRLERHLLDWIGLFLGGRTLAASSPSVIAGIDALAGGSAVDASILTGHSLAPDRTALLAGTFAHSLDFDDTHRESSLHPGAPVIAAALSVVFGERTTGTDLLAAISLGYDVACAMGCAVGPDAHYDRGFHLTATCGTFGATAAAGHLRGFDAATFESAFGINGSQAAGSLQFLENGAWNKRVHPGLAASRAIQAVELADAGFRGAADPIEGTHGFLDSYTDAPNPDVLSTIEPGAAVRETGLKPYPCCRYVHAAIDGTLDIADRVDPDAVESVRVDVPEPGVRLTGDPIAAKRRPSNFVDCQFSAPFAIALALMTGEAGLRAFLDAQDRLDDPALQRLMDRVDVVSTPRTNSPFPGQWTAHVTVEAGRTYERFVQHPRGEPENPLTHAAVEEKFRDLSAAADVPAVVADDVIETITGLSSRSTAALFTSLERAESSLDAT